MFSPPHLSLGGDGRTGGAVPGTVCFPGTTESHSDLSAKGRGTKREEN